MASGGVLSAILSEQPDDVLADLKRQLEERIAEARGTIAQSESELRVVEQAIATRRPLAAAGPPESTDADADAERDRESDGRFQGIPRTRILEVALELGYPITPARVVEAFAERGMTVNVEQIRIALGRIAKDGNLTKVGPSLFAGPDGQTAEAAPSPASETDAPRGPFRQSGFGAPVRSDVFRRSG